MIMNWVGYWFRRTEKAEIIGMKYYQLSLNKALLAKTIQGQIKMRTKFYMIIHNFYTNQPKTTFFSLKTNN